MSELKACSQLSRLKTDLHRTIITNTSSNLLNTTIPYFRASQSRDVTNSYSTQQAMFISEDHFGKFLDSCYTETKSDHTANIFLLRMVL